MSAYRVAQLGCSKTRIIPADALDSSGRQQTNWSTIEKGRTQVLSATSFP
jgi:hypothetical protein